MPPPGSVLPLLLLPLQLSLLALAIKVSSATDNAALSQSTSLVSSQKSNASHPTGALDAGPSRSNGQPVSTTQHLPFPSPSLHSSLVGHPSSSQLTHPPVTQRPSPPVDPFPHHPNPNPSNSTFNSSDTPFHPPLHPHPSPAPSPHSGSSKLTATEIFFAALGGLVGLAILLAIARCIYVYRKTPSSRRSPTPEVGEVERTLSLLRPSRILNLGDRIIPPPPYQNAPDYDAVVNTSSGGNESTRTQSPGASTTADLVFGATQTISIPRSTRISETPSATITSTSDNAMSGPRLPESIPSNTNGRPPDTHT